MNSRIENLTAAVVGTVFIGPVHVEGLGRAGVHVVGIVGSTPDKSQIAAERLEGFLESRLLALRKSYDFLRDYIPQREVGVRATVGTWPRSPLRKWARGLL